MQHDEFREAIQNGDLEAVRGALAADPGLASRTIVWDLQKKNESDPLHFVSDCVAHGWLTNGTEAAIAELLIAHGAPINGSPGREAPLIGAVSLGAERVARLLIEAGADLESRSIFGSRAIHWAAWVGSASIVERLIVRGAEIEPRCTEFAATPLFWAVRSWGPDGPREKKEQVAAARLLIDAGASVHSKNKQGVSALDLARSNPRQEMFELMRSVA